MDFKVVTFLGIRKSYFKVIVVSFMVPSEPSTFGFIIIKTLFTSGRI